MTISYSANIIVGIPADEILYEDVVRLKLETFQPYYDSIPSQSLVGIKVFSSGNYNYSVLPNNYKIEEAISLTFARFLALTGKVGNMYLTVDSY